MNNKYMYIVYIYIQYVSLKFTTSSLTKCKNFFPVASPIPAFINFPSRARAKVMICFAWFLERKQTNN